MQQSGDTAFTFQTAGPTPEEVAHIMVSTAPTMTAPTVTAETTEAVVEIPAEKSKQQKSKDSFLKDVAHFLHFSILFLSTFMIFKSILEPDITLR